MIDNNLPSIIIIHKVFGGCGSSPQTCSFFYIDEVGGGRCSLFAIFFLVAQKSGTVWATPDGVWPFFDAWWALLHAAEVFSMGGSCRALPPRPQRRNLQFNPSQSSSKPSGGGLL